MENIKELFSKAGIKLNDGEATPAEPVVEAPETPEVEGNEVKLETNANEIMHTGNTGYGAELVPANVFASAVYDSMPTLGSFLGMLPGYHGSDMAVSMKVPVVGDPGYFEGNTEPTTGAMAIAQGTVLQPTAAVTITQKELIMSIDVTRRELTYSAIDLQGLLIDRISRAFVNTVESMIINGDSETGATGNVNSDDQAPATTFATTGAAADHRLLIDHGLRELAINGSYTTNAGIFDISDFPSIMADLGSWAASPEDNLWLFNAATYTKALGIAEFLNMSTNGKLSTINGAALKTNLFGSDAIKHKAVPKTEADGKMSSTGSNNTLGQIIYFRKPAVQWGYGRPIELDVFKVPGKGVQVIATAEFGFAIAQKLAGDADSSVAAGINITV